MRITFETDGGVKFIYDDALAPIAEEIGAMSIQRASHVEPSGTDWFADMSPVNGPFIGPCKTRAEALEREREWLLEHDIPRPYGLRLVKS